jgi:CBS domain-containing protein
VFALELTHDVNMLLPLIVAVTCAYAVTVLGVRRSILTEKIARRGFHVTREYAVDPLEILFVREVMRPMRTGMLPEMTRMVAHPDESLRAVAYRMARSQLTRITVVDRGAPAVPIGEITLSDLLSGRRRTLDAEQRRERVLSLPFVDSAARKEPA